MTEMKEEDILSGIRIAYNQIQKFIENPTRKQILKRLKKKGKLTWTEMQKELEINPNMIKHHTNALIENGLIRKSNPGFELTNAGNAIMNMDLKEMEDIIKLGLVAHRRKKE